MPHHPLSCSTDPCPGSSCGWWPLLQACSAGPLFSSSSSVMSHQSSIAASCISMKGRWYFRRRLEKLTHSSYVVCRQCLRGIRLIIEVLITPLDFREPFSFRARCGWGTLGVPPLGVNYLRQGTVDRRARVFSFHHSMCYSSIDSLQP